MAENKLYYGDNLDILRRYLDSESVDLIYLDPPFNSNQDYNVLFAEQDGTRSAAQISAFQDTWRWDAGAVAAFDEAVRSDGRVAATMQAFYTMLGASNMLAYLSMMAPRLVELRRVLKETGSIYLHCDPTASHYLKLLMDSVFGPENFKNEIVWKRTTAHNDPKKYGNIHDVILFYSKSNKNFWKKLYTPYTPEYIKSEWNELPSGRFYKCENMLDPRGKMKEFVFKGTKARWRTNEEGMLKFWNEPQTEVPNSHGKIKLGKNGKPTKRCRIIFLDEMPGVPLQTIWNDIFSLKGGAAERLGYPTQKPLALLERIISASSNEGDVVLDPFCGCGTAIDAAQKLGRRWIGIDVTHLAITLIKHRLHSTYGKTLEFDIIGEPKDDAGAKELAQADPWQFQWWSLGLVDARPVEQKKGADKGVDGRLFFRDESKGALKQIVISVKAGTTGPAHVRELRGVIEREKAAIGLLITMQEPTKKMREEAVDAGLYQSPGGTKHPRLQLRTVAELMEGKALDYPRYAENVTFKKAPKSQAGGHQQSNLL
ncbi:MAG: restriction endonuclease [Proteobacteria bacterium]|nr:restriction endonuclease [Pseudomonadota bacterium]MBU1452335.1 restriction endonuclease [Pseudomonadota bacterium]MBU2468346.1 restriction endonuclease [Pseudomonadota bacterium]MBU2516217.1 restriction endonuclease [Pseudomonadota bacterium]